MIEAVFFDEVIHSRFLQSKFVDQPSMIFEPRGNSRIGREKDFVVEARETHPNKPAFLAGLWRFDRGDGSNGAMMGSRSVRKVFDFLKRRFWVIHLKTLFKGRDRCEFGGRVFWHPR